MAKLFIITGSLLLLVGLLLFVFPNLLFWFGNTWGDFSYKTKNIKLFFPLGSMIIVSVLLSLIMNFILK